MSIGRYYGYAAGAVARWHGNRVMDVTIGTVDRPPPEGADWLLRFTPRRSLANGRSLALRLNKLAVSYARGEVDVRRYMDAIDCAIVDADTKP